MEPMTHYYSIEEIERKIKLLVQLGTYVDNEETFEKCIVFNSCKEGLFPHEISILQIVDRIVIDDLKHPALLHALGISNKASCLESLLIRGFIKCGFPPKYLNRLSNGQLRKLIKHYHIVGIQGTDSYSLRRAIDEKLSQDEIIDCLNYKIYFLSEKGEHIVEKYHDIKIGKMDTWSCFGNLSCAEVFGLSWECHKYILQRYREIFKLQEVVTVKSIGKYEEGFLINEFAGVLDKSKIYSEGVYRIGKDIPSGEYYFWGNGVLVLNSKGRQINKDEDATDFYLVLNERNKIEVKDGYFTEINNLSYYYNVEAALKAGHMYRVGKELPQGVYSYSQNGMYQADALLDKYECVVKTFNEYPPSSPYNVEKGMFGTFDIKGLNRYVKIYGGDAYFIRYLETKRSESREKAYKSELNHRIISKKDDTSLIICGDRFVYYVSIVDPIAEVFINNHYQDCTVVQNLFKDDNSLNYCFSIHKDDKDEIALVLYLLKNKYIDFPKIFGVSLTELYYYALHGYPMDYKNRNIYDVVDRLEIDGLESYYVIYKKLKQIFPIKLLVDFYAIETYTEGVHPNSPKQYYYDIINNEDYYKKKYQEVILGLAEKGLVNPKWKNEFALYILVKSFFQDVEYQYRAEWLGQQSLDIYIPSLKVGIEYQGAQHYEMIELFGGSEGFTKRQELDAEKREKCKAAAVKLIEWKYDIPITEEYLRNIFSQVGIEVREKRMPYTSTNFDKGDPDVSSIVIYQYDQEGNFLAEYATIKEACEATGTKGVGKVINGQQRFAGGYVWRKVEHGHSTDKIVIELKDTNTKFLPSGGKQICQIDDKGNVIKIFHSISAASREIGVNQKSIRLCAKGVQKRAGGYSWKYKED